MKNSNYKTKRNLSYKLYYVIGSIVLFIFLFLFVFFLVLPLALNDFPEYLGWVAIIVCMISFVGIIFGVYLLKKGTFLKLNERRSEEDKATKEKIKEIYEKHNRYEESDEY